MPELWPEEVVAVELWIWVVLASAAGIAVAGAWCTQRAPRVFTIDHVRVELHDAHIVDDRVIDAVWRAAISMTNTSRRPRALPLLGERATVRAGNRVHLASVYLDADVDEVNPRDATLAWVEFALPTRLSPSMATVVQLREHRPARAVQFLQIAAPADKTITTSGR